MPVSRVTTGETGQSVRIVYETEVAADPALQVCFMLVVMVTG